jgi:hypothetical protein
MNEYVKHLVLQNDISIQNNWTIVKKWVTKYHNDLVDALVAQGGNVNINADAINNDILSVYHPQILKKYQEIYKSNVVITVHTNKVILDEIARGVAKDVSRVASERVVKNLDAVNKILTKAEVDISKYNQMAKSFPKVDRLNIIQKAADKGSNWKGQTYSYKQLDNLNKGITRYVENKSLQDKYELNFEQSEANNKTPIKKEKVWVWSQLENTRHSSMDGQTVDINEPFIVTNELTGAVDELMFPGDFENDENNCSNICNCDCSVLYI